MTRNEKAAEIVSIQAKIAAGKALIIELDNRAKQALKAGGINSTEYHALCAAIDGIAADGERLNLLIAELQNSI